MGPAIPQLYNPPHTGNNAILLGLSEMMYLTVYILKKAFKVQEFQMDKDRETSMRNQLLQLEVWNHVKNM